MEIRKLALLSCLLIGATLHAQDDNAGAVCYSLPRTVVRVEAEAVREVFHAGPYARYSWKYLGMEAREQDSNTCRLESVRLEPLTEADPAARYALPQVKTLPSVLELSAQGLVSLGGNAPGSTRWSFEKGEDGGFAAAGLTSNLTSESATLYRRNSAGGQAAVQQQMVVEKSPEAKAKEAADIIFDLRRKKMQIVTGDSDAVFSGEALGAAIAEIDRLEQEYLSLFIGYSEFIPSKMVFDVIPRKDAKNQRYIAFRLSEDEGLVPSDNVSGKPYILELVPEKVAAVTDAKASKGNVIYYRIPSICTVRLSDGVNVLISSRMPVSQLGATSTIPVK